MKRLFALILRFYPGAQREWLADEMIRVFAEAAADQRARGRFAYARFAVQEMTGLLLGSARAWARLRRADPGIDLRKMRPPELSKAEYGTALDEVLAARRLVADKLARMQDAIARTNS